MNSIVGAVPLSAEMPLAKLPVKKVKDFNLKDECPICFIDYKGIPAGAKGEYSVICATDCNHFFHTFCLLQWLKSHSSCPMCRKKLQSQQVREITLTEVILKHLEYHRKKPKASNKPCIYCHKTTGKKRDIQEDVCMRCHKYYFNSMGPIRQKRH